MSGQFFFFLQEMAMSYPIMMMEAGIRAGTMEEVGDEVEVVISVDVEEVDIMVPRWMPKRIWEVTIKKPPFKVEVKFISLIFSLKCCK